MASHNFDGYEAMAFSEPRYTVQEVNAAGKALVRYLGEPSVDTWGDEDWRAYRSAVDVINNWRGAHAYPLNTFQINLRNVTRRLTSNPLVAQRIKRLFSIGLKLQLHPNMKLSQMQDLGGCRAILNDVASVKKVVEYYEKKSGIKHKRLPTDDYIIRPKASGYRGVHLIYRYVSDKNKKAYNDLKIEMQLRSKYQHAWATAVETVGMFSGQALKSSLGSDDWKRFFALMGSAIAMREQSEIIPNTPTSKQSLIDELRDFSQTLQVASRLKQYNKALSALSNNVASNAYFYLLQLDPSRGTLQVKGYSANEVLEAEKQYAKAEEDVKSDGGDAVLVSVDSINSLRKAYPNYFADTRLFLELMEQALSGRSRSIRISDIKLAEG